MVYEHLKRIFAGLAGIVQEMEVAYLFGSRLEGNPGPLSDYDVSVLLSRTASATECRSRLSSLLSGKLGSQRVEVVCLNDVPVELAFSIISSGALIYARDEETRVEYEARVMSQYFDYLPVLRAFRHDILKGGDHATRVQRYRKALGRTQRTLGEIRALQGQVPLRF